MNYQKYRYEKIKSEINIVPFLDILLILVIILMITSPVIVQNIEVELPESTNPTTFTFNDSSFVIVEVLGIGQYNLIINNNRKKNLSSEQIFTEVRNRINIDSNTTFLIGGTKNVIYEEIINMLHLLNKAGIKSVGLMTRTI